MKKFNKKDYTLSFWVQGVSVFVTDIHVDVYKDLEVLFLIDNGMFKQYFTNIAYNKTLDRGLKFYSEKNAFTEYQTDLIKHLKTFKDFYSKEIRKKEKLSQSVVKTFFKYTIKLCKDYTKMNFEFTDKAFSNQEKNPIIKKNLALMSQFKDKVRSFMNTVLFEKSRYSSEFFTILAKQFNLDPKILADLTQQEILGLFEGKKPNLHQISKRQTAFLINYDRSAIDQGQNVLTIIQSFRDTASSTKTVNGTPASLGKATGKVKVINVDYKDIGILNAEISKMEKGNILIAETTAPELIIACQKAAAIVTDVGGLLSHAAIVSREFGIPCIVATGNATKVFKDGDMVEVDAEKGIVTKIR